MTSSSNTDDHSISASLLSPSERNQTNKNHLDNTLTDSILGTTASSLPNNKKNHDGIFSEEASALFETDDADSAVDDDLLIRMNVLSRVIERYRFLIPSERINDEVNAESLTWLFELDPPRHLLIKKRQQEMKMMKNGKGNANNNNNNDTQQQQQSSTTIGSSLEMSSQNPVTLNLSPRSAGWSKLHNKLSAGAFAKYDDSNDDDKRKSDENENNDNDDNAYQDDRKDSKNNSTSSSKDVEDDDEGKGSGKEKKKKIVKKRILDANDDLVEQDTLMTDHDDEDETQQQSKENKDKEDKNKNDNTTSSHQKQSDTTDVTAQNSSKQQQQHVPSSKWRNLRNMPLPSTLLSKKKNEKKLADLFAKSSAIFRPSTVNLNSMAATSDENSSNNNNNTDSERLIAPAQEPTAAKPNKGLRPLVFANRFISGLKETVKENMQEISSGVYEIAGDLGIVDSPEDELHHQNLAKNKDGGNSNSNNNNEINELAELASNLWRFCTHLHGDVENGKKIPFQATFRQLFEFDSEYFPFTTYRQREILRSFEDEVLVSRDELGFALGKEENREEFFGDDFEPILNCIFGGGSGKLKEYVGAAFDRVVSCVHQHPVKQNYALTIGQSIEQAKTNLSLVFTTVIMIIVTLVVIPQLEISTMYRFQRGQWGSVTGDWPNFCKENTTDANSCFLIRQNIDNVRTTQQIEFFCREFITTMLWNGDGVTSGSKDAFYGNIRIGGMLMKSSPRVSSKSRQLCKVKTCSELNLTQDVYEFEYGGTFTCDAYDAEPNSIVLIPFNATASEAMALAQTFEPRYGCSASGGPIEDSVVTIQFAMLQPSNHLLSFTTISFTVPRGGRVVPRTYTTVAHLTASEFVIALATTKIVTFFFLFVNILFRRSEGRWRLFNFRMLLEYAMTAMCIASVIIISELPTTQQVLDLSVQTEYIPANVDHWISRYDVSLALIGWFTIVFFVYATNIFADFLSLSVITKLLKVSSKDVVVLFILFFWLAVGFLGVARILFGPTTYEFSTASMSSVEMLKFFTGGATFDLLAQQNPIAGNLFTFAALAFAVIIALNLLISVISSRLGEMNDRANLHLELEEKINSDAANFEGNERFWFPLRRWSLTLVSVLADALPFSTSAFKWKTFNKHMSKLYRPYTRLNPPNVSLLVNHAIQLIDFLDQASSTNMMTEEEENDQYGNTTTATTDDYQKFSSSNNSNRKKIPIWNSVLRRSIDTYQPFDQSAAAWLFLERVILLQSNHNLVRDAALLRVLMEYDAASTDIEKVISFQDEQEEKVVKEREFLSSGLSKRHQKYFKDHKHKFGQSAAVIHKEVKENHHQDNGSSSSSPPGSPPHATTGDGTTSPSITHHVIFNFGGKSSSSHHHHHHHTPNNKNSHDSPPSSSLPSYCAPPASPFSSSFTPTNSNSSNQNNNNDDDDDDDSEYEQPILLQRKNSKVAPLLNLSMTTSGSAFASQVFSDHSHKTVNVEKQKKKLLTGMVVSAHRQKFWINQWIVRGIKRSLYFPVRSIVVFALYLAFVLFSVLTYKESATWLAENLKDGLAEHPYVQNCDDIDCHSGFTTTKTFQDVMVGLDNDVAQFVDRLVIPKLFPRLEDLPFPYNASQEQDGRFPVAFDRNIRRKTPVTVRQILASKFPCQQPSTSALESSSTGRKQFFQNLECYNTNSDSFETQPLPRSSTSPFPEDAYLFKDSCIENEPILGSYEYYPCSGYSVDVHNSTQMKSIVSDFLQPAARLVVFSATFTTRDRALLTPPPLNNEGANTDDTVDDKNDIVRISMYFETAPGNAGGIIPFVFLTTEKQPMFAQFAFLGFMNLGIELLFFVTTLLQYARYAFKNRNIGGFLARHVQHHAPDIPYTSIITLIAVIVIVSVPGMEQANRNSYTLAVVVIAATSNFMTFVIFPISKVISFRAVFIIRSIVRAVNIVLIIVPFYFFSVLAFTIGGSVLFGRNTLEFATFRMSLNTIGRGVMGDFDIDTVFAQQPYSATFFGAGFFVVILVVLSNLLLSLVLLSVDEAKAETTVGEYVGMVAEFQDKNVMAGEYVSFILAVHLAEHHIFKRVYYWCRDAWNNTVAKLQLCFKSKKLQKREEAEEKAIRELLAAAHHHAPTDENDDDGVDNLNETRKMNEQIAEENWKSRRDIEAKKTAEAEVVRKVEMMSPTGRKLNQKAKNEQAEVKQLYEKIITPAVRRANEEYEALMKLDERGGQLFVTSSGRFLRALETLQMSLPPFVLHELSESIHLSEISESFIYSVVLYLARKRREFQDSFSSQLTFDLAEGSLLLAGFREAIELGLEDKKRKEQLKKKRRESVASKQQ